MKSCILIALFIGVSAQAQTIVCTTYSSSSSQYSVEFTTDDVHAVNVQVKNKKKNINLNFKCRVPEPCIDIPGQSSCGSRPLNDQVIYVCDDGILDGSFQKPTVSLNLNGTNLGADIWYIDGDTEQLACKTRGK